MNNFIIPPLDPDFSPLSVFSRSYLEKTENEGGKEIIIGLVNENYSYEYRTSVFLTGHEDETSKYISFIIKSLLWIYGASSIYISDENIYRLLCKLFSKGGILSSDAEEMKSYYGDFCVIKGRMPAKAKREIKKKEDKSADIIGLDIGCTGRKVCAVSDGKVVFSSNMPWTPKEYTSLEIIKEKIKESINSASEYLKKVDKIGISTAGVCSENKVITSTVFNGIKESEQKISQTLYIDAARELGIKNITVINDGDAAAFSAVINDGLSDVLGISLGTGLGGGYVDENGLITGIINELEFVPIDSSSLACDFGKDGCAAEYLSSKAVIKLAEKCGISFSEKMTPGEKVLYVSNLLERGNKEVYNIYKTIGIYLGYAICHYSYFYKMKHVKVMGGITMGQGGEIIRDMAKKVLEAEFPPEKMPHMFFADDKSRLLGQAYAAAFLPILD